MKRDSPPSHRQPRKHTVPDNAAKCGEGKAPSAQNYNSLPYLVPSAGAAVPDASRPRMGEPAGAS